MHRPSRCRPAALAALTVLLLATFASPALALRERQETARFDRLAVPEAGAVIGVTGRATAELPAGDALRGNWDRFAAEQGGGWQAWIDERSGLPLLAQGRGIALFDPNGEVRGLDQVEALVRKFLDSHAYVLGSWEGQLVLDREASGRLGDNLWQVTFRQAVGGVPVAAARYDFHLGSGKIVSFGATRWAPVRHGAVPALQLDAARAALESYLGLSASNEVEYFDHGTLRLVPVDPAGQPGSAWGGARGAGYDHLLAWRFGFRVPGEPQTWIADVDADTGRIVSLFDETKYDRVKGGVYPVSSDQDCPSGCEQLDWPMPYVDYSVDGGPIAYTGDHGLYECAATGAEVATTLKGQYVRVNDSCGTIRETTTCDDPLDLRSGPGQDCAVPEGASAGNTHAARSSFFHLNRAMENGRAWLPDNTWLKQPLTDNVNISPWCNATWSGNVNFYRSSTGCRNTGEIAAVFVHEWGHGIDQNDGGGYDSPSEAYSDCVAFLALRESCVGRGFYTDHPCDGYGDACLECTGIREQDWDMREDHTPATPAGFLQSYCGGGGGPCGKEEHCESYVAGEAMWDLATRDLPTMMDQASAFQLAERLFMKSRKGSGGNAYNCSLPNSDGCGTGAWFHKLRLIDDDDANLANGTPHAAAIFAAFNRHKIACGSAADASNQNTNSCPALAKPVVTTRAISNAVELSWPAVPNAASYLVLRNDTGCDRSQNIVGRVDAPATTFADDELSNDFPVNYRVQAIGANEACQSAVSDCISAAPQPLAGRVRFQQDTYGCSNDVTLKVTDANVGAPTLVVTVWSASEPQPETVVLAETAPNSAKYVGSIHSTADAAVHGDGLLTILNGDAMLAEYVDADDGIGGINVVTQDNATADCVFPVINGVSTTNVTDVRATISWTTDEISDTTAIWGPMIPPDQPKTGAARTTQHTVDLTGLTSCTVYYYQVRSADPAGNVALADNGGAYYHFETLGNFGSGLQPCHAGRVSAEEPTYFCHDSATFRLVDMDINVNPTLAETVVVLVSSTSEPVAELVTLTESGPNSSVFTGAIATAAGAPVPDGVLQVAHGDVLTVTYLDGDDGTGASAISFDTANLDCNGPQITNLRVDAITSARVTINFTTAEPGDTTIEWGTTPALGQVAHLAALTTNHSVVLNQFDICQQLYFRVRTVDQFGNEVVSDQSGAPHTVTTADIPGLYWRATFEDGAPGWTLGGEWQVGEPKGLQGGSCAADPAAAYNNRNVLGYDLTGTGGTPGGYEPNTNQKARMPQQNPSSWQNTKLILYHQINTAQNDFASLWLWTQQGRPLYRDENVRETSFQYQSWDVAQYVDGQQRVFLEFQQESDAGGSCSGWNVDDIIFKDGTKPDYAACATCAGTPSFAGARSAVDNNACGANGVTVSWDRAAAWGSGGGGTYAVYRGTAPGFPADTAHRVAMGVTTLSYNDATAPAGQLYYLVRAESDETCSTGPNNHGRTDGNTVYVDVRETTTRPLPDQVGPLQVGLVAAAHVRIGWDPVTEASRYRVYRSPSPEPGTFGVLGESATTWFDDLGSGANAETYFYFAKGINACGQEGP
ncbi:MAG: fibronectin type III domain-containing protein [Acidobacteria bacterium]|nr:fibronectin type III domain-containing protein [Acidobacteriota bacterium]